MEQITSLQVTFIASVWSPQEDLCVGLDTAGEWDTESPRIMGLIFPLIESHTVGCETWDCHWKIFWSELFLTIVSSCVVLCEYRHYRQFLAPSSYLWGGGRGERCCCHAMFGLDTIGVSGNTVFVITVWLVSSIVMRYLDCSFLGLPLFLAVKLAVVNCSVWLFCVIWYSCCCYSYCCCCCCCLSSCWCYCCLSNCFCSWISYCCCSQWRPGSILNSSQIDHNRDHGFVCRPRVVVIWSLPWNTLDCTAANQFVYVYRRVSMGVDLSLWLWLVVFQKV